MNDPATPTLAGRDAGDTLLLVDADRAQCRERLLDALGETAESTAVLLVDAADPAGGAEGLRRRGVGSEAVGVLDATREETSISGIAEFESVAGPGSLSALGIAISDQLDRLAHRFDRVVVGIDSVTDLRAASSVPATFRFLHVLRGRVRTTDALLVGTIDRSAHEEETLRTVAELFEETVGCDAGGE